MSEGLDKKKVEDRGGGQIFRIYSKQNALASKMKRIEQLRIPRELNYDEVVGLSSGPRKAQKLCLIIRASKPYIGRNTIGFAGFMDVP